MFTTSFVESMLELVFAAIEAVLHALLFVVEALVHISIEGFPEVFNLIQTVSTSLSFATKYVISGLQLIAHLALYVISGLQLITHLARKGAQMVWNATSSASSFLDDFEEYTSKERSHIRHSTSRLFSWLMQLLGTLWPTVLHVAIITITLVGVIVMVHCAYLCLTEMKRRRSLMRTRTQAQYHRYNNNNRRTAPARLRQPARSRPVTTQELDRERQPERPHSSGSPRGSSLTRRKQPTYPKPSAPPRDLICNSDSEDTPTPSAPPFSLLTNENGTIVRGETRSDSPPVRVNSQSNEATDSPSSSDHDLLRRQLHQANEQLSMEIDKSLCVICLDNTRELVLKPCNHYCLCSSCSNGLTECPLCLKKIHSTEKIFHA